MNTGPPSHAEIDLDALIHNLGRTRQLAGPDKQVIASVKGNAYGHGVLDVAQALQEGSVLVGLSPRKQAGFAGARYPLQGGSSP